MPRFSELKEEFVCPYRHGCPYLEGLSTQWVWERFNETAGLECRYEYQIQALDHQLDQAREENEALRRESQQLKAQLEALHRRQFKGRRARKADAPAASGSDGQKKKQRGAPVGHPPWQRSKPKHIDQTVSVPAPKTCPHCHGADLQPVEEQLEHIQEDIVLQPRTVATRYVHQQSYCPHCERNVVQPGPGELLGSYIGPAAKATAIYMRYELNVSDRKISRFFGEFFGLKFVPASAYGFERQAVRRGLPLYEDLRQKIRALPVAHGDETSWRHDGDNYFVWYGGDEQLAFYVFAPDRSGATAQSLFGEHFSGILVSDGYAAYHAVHPKDWQSCLFHIKNKAKELEAELALLQGRAADPEAQQFCQKIRGFVHTACQAHRHLPRGSRRARAAKNKAKNLSAQLRRLCRRPLTHPKTETFRQRLIGPEHRHLFTCFRHPQVPPTNAQAEQSMRPVVLMRHVVHGTRSPKGLENHSVLRSLFATARRQGKKVHQFFVDLFTLDTEQAQAALYRHPPLPEPADSKKTAAKNKPP
jgi:transposase